MSRDNSELLFKNKNTSETENAYGVTEKTKKIELSVTFPTGVTPVNLRFEIQEDISETTSVKMKKCFFNTPKGRKKIIHDVNSNTYSVIEKKPIIGYAYALRWEWEF